MPTCFSLEGSTQCPAYNQSSVSTSSSLYDNFPFMKDVSNVTHFDQALSDYVKDAYVKQKYVNYLGCEDANLTSTDDFYARYTTTSICSGIVQTSKKECKLSDEQSRPLCADSCADMAKSEGQIILNTDLCPKKESNYMDQIRSDFTVCALPADSLTVTCIEGSENEPDECGYGTNLVGLCGFCGASSPNSTDSCCVNANAGTRCKDVSLPSATTLPPIVTTTSTTAAASSHHGLSGGQIAGIVIGSVAAAALIIALIILVLIYWRRRRRMEVDAALNQPNPQRKGSPSMQHGGNPQAFVNVPGGRVTRMAALREAPSFSPRSRTSGAMYDAAKYSDSSDSEGASPGAMSKRIPPTTGKRTASLSSHSMLAGTNSDSSPYSKTTKQHSSPEAISSGQSEQLSSFQDYYSQDDMHPGDRVAVLWAYQPRAGDEFALDRGEMLKVIGIWDDGWATGIRVPETAEEYHARRREQRDSGVSNGSQRTLTSPTPTGEIKAFPLVCVCLPQHWRKIIDGGQGNEQ